MSELSLHLPKSLYEQLRELAQEEGISVNQFVMLAVAEKIATISTIEYLENRAKRGSREKFLEILNKAPDVEPDESDRLWQGLKSLAPDCFRRGYIAAIFVYMVAGIEWRLFQSYSTLLRNSRWLGMGRGCYHCK